MTTKTRTKVEVDEKRLKKLLAVLRHVVRAYRVQAGMLDYEHGGRGGGSNMVFMKMLSELERELWRFDEVQAHGPDAL